jgi:methyl-accepting chemotaxis protein
MEKTITNLRGDMTAVQKRLHELDKVNTERDMLVITSENYAHIDEELEKLSQRVNEGKGEVKTNHEAINRLKETVDRISSENKKLHVMAQQHKREAKENQETINRLNKTVDRISSENKNLHDRMETLVQQHKKEAKENQEAINKLNETLGRIRRKLEKLDPKFTKNDHIVAGRNEAMKLLSAAEYRKQVSYSFPSCRESGKFQQNFK